MACRELEPLKQLLVLIVEACGNLWTKIDIKA
jgi:hypothetical protein